MPSATLAKTQHCDNSVIANTKTDRFRENEITEKGNV